MISTFRARQRRGFPHLPPPSTHAMSSSTRRAKLRLHLLGGQGSGKTHAAGRLADALGVPVLHLDDLFRDPGTPIPWTRKLEPEAHAAPLDAFVSGPGWIVEGVYHKWCEATFRRADRVIVLTPPRWIRQLRMAGRSVRRHCTRDRDRESLRVFLSVLRLSHRHERDELGPALAWLAAAGISPLRCANFREIGAAIPEAGLSR